MKDITSGWKEEGEYPSFSPKKIESFLTPIERNEIIQPYLDEWERNTLINLLKNNARNKKIDKIQRNDVEYKFEKFIDNNLSTIYDLYNLYNTPSKELKLVGETEHNANRFKFILKANEPNIKPVTQNHSLYSYTVIEELVHALFELIVEEGNSNQEDSIVNFGQGDGESGGEQENKEQEKEQEKQQEEKLEDTIQKGLDNGANEVDKINKQGIGGNTAGNNSSDMHTISEDLAFLAFMKKIHVDPKMLAKFAKQVGKLSCNYFSPRSKENEIPILEADEIEELEGLENLISPLDVLLYNDLTTTSKTYMVGFDVYVDYSASMDDFVYLNSGEMIMRLNLCKVCALKLIDSKIVEEVHFFDTKFKKNVTKEELLAIRPNGGTNIDMVIKDIKASSKSALILTDLEDRISIYDPNVFFISFEKFRRFRSNDIGKKYLRNGQCVYFDGDVFKIIKN